MGSQVFVYLSERQSVINILSPSYDAHNEKFMNDRDMTKTIQLHNPQVYLLYKIRNVTNVLQEQSVMSPTYPWVSVRLPQI